ncbi:hypothetical protein GCM10009528_05150 [Kineococcus aurantiacus]
MDPGATLREVERRTEAAHGRPLPAPRTAWTVWFCLLGGCYGLTTWIGELPADSGHDVVRSVAHLVLTALRGVPGFALASAVAEFVHGNSAGLTGLLVPGSFLQFCLFGTFSCLFASTPGLFPTRARLFAAGSVVAVLFLPETRGAVLEDIAR